MRRAIALAAVLALAGCGGSSSSRSSSSSSATAVPAAYQTEFGPSAHSPTFGLPPKGVRLPRPVSGEIPTVTMLDSVSSVSIFSGLNPVAVAGYTSGSWPTYFAYAGHFKYVVAVMVNAAHFGQSGAARSCLDVEPGDATPSEAGPWDRTELARGFVPCDYGSLSEMPAIKASIASSGIPLSRVMLWDADWTFAPRLDAGYQATQWTDHYDNRNIDGSTISQAFVSATVPPSKPAVICWGRGATPASSACGKIAGQSHHYWVEYQAFSAGERRDTKLLAPVQGRINALAANKTPVSVPGYRGAGGDYLAARIKAEQHWLFVDLAVHKRIDAAHTGH